MNATAHPGSLLQLTLPVRDLSQSENGNVLDIAHPLLLEGFYPRIADFNAAGPLQIQAVETPCGAQPQVDVFRGRWPLETMRKIHSALPYGVAARILIRGPFGVSLSPLATSDLFFMLQELALASGAADGRLVIFKLFEAQNNPAEKRASSRIIKMLQAQGLYISLEDATCFTADSSFQPVYYQERIQQALAIHDEDFLGFPSILSAVSLKDMIGGLDSRLRDPKTPDYADAAVLTSALSDTVKAHADEHVVVALHSHETGFSTEAYAAAMDVACKKNQRFRPDVMPSGQSFAWIENVLRYLEESDPRAVLTAKQKEIVQDMSEVLEEVRSMYTDYHIDTTVLSGEERRRVKIPGGAVPSTVRLFLQPLADRLKLPFAEAKELLLRHMERAWHDLGKPHSVTPGAKFLGQTAYLKALREAKAVAEGEELPHAELYRDLPTELLMYWRGEMPIEPDSAVFHCICDEYLKRVLPDLLPEDEYKFLHNSLREHPTNKEHAQKQLAQQGLAVSEEAAQLFARDDVKGLLDNIEQLHFYLSVPDALRFHVEKHGQGPALSFYTQQRELFEQELADNQEKLKSLFAQSDLDFVSVFPMFQRVESLLDHVGLRTRPISIETAVRVAQLQEEVQRIEDLGIPLHRSDDAVFAGLLMAPSSNQLLDLSAQKLVFTPRENFPEEWSHELFCDPGYENESPHSGLALGEQAQQVALFWRKLAQNFYLNPDWTSSEKLEGFYRDIQQISEPSVYEWVLSQQRMRKAPISLD